MNKALSIEIHRHISHTRMLLIGTSPTYVCPNLTMMDRIFPMVFLVVTLNLLITVMVMSNPGCQGVYIKLPVTCNPDPFPNTDEFPKVTIKKDGSTFFDQNILDVNSLQGLISNHSQKVVIAADTRLAYKDVKKTLELLSIFGVSDFVLLAEKANH